MFIIYAFQKPADVINGCQSQVVHCHELRLLWTKLAKIFEKKRFTDDKIVFWGACKVLISAWSPFGLKSRRLVVLDPSSSWLIKQIQQSQALTYIQMILF